MAFNRKRTKESFWDSDDFKRLEKNTYNFLGKLETTPYPQRIKMISDKAEEEKKKKPEDRFMLWTLLEDVAKGELLEYCGELEKRIEKLEKLIK